MKITVLRIGFKFSIMLLSLPTPVGSMIRYSGHRDDLIAILDITTLLG